MKNLFGVLSPLVFLKLPLAHQNVERSARFPGGDQIVESCRLQYTSINNYVCQDLVLEHISKLRYVKIYVPCGFQQY